MLHIRLHLGQLRLAHRDDARDPIDAPLPRLAGQRVAVLVTSHDAVHVERPDDGLDALAVELGDGRQLAQRAWPADGQLVDDGANIGHRRERAVDEVALDLVILASTGIAASRRARRRGLLGRSELEGALVLRPCRQVHTIGMRFPVDVVWCNRKGRVLRIAPPNLAAGREVQETTLVRSTGVPGGFSAPVNARNIASEHKVEPVLLQGIAAAVVFVVGALAALWFAGMRAGTVDFLIATDSEMKRVNWSTPREVRGSTYVVIGACFLLAGALFVFDLFFQAIFRGIGILSH